MSRVCTTYCVICRDETEHCGSKKFINMWYCTECAVWKAFLKDEVDDEAKLEEEPPLPTE